MSAASPAIDFLKEETRQCGYLDDDWSKALVYADPWVEGVYAVRLPMEDDNYDFVVYLNLDEPDFEECEFNSWPPKAGY